jgi:phosphatidylethanolamine-binding protein
MIAVGALVLAALGLVHAQSIPATASETDLQTVEGQYDAAGFYQAPSNAPTSLAFGIKLDADALLTVAYGDHVVQNGEALNQDQVSSQPTLYVTPSTENAAKFGSGNQFTVLLTDASALGNPDPRGFYRHYLANGVTTGAASGSDNQTLPVSGGTVITNYAGPGPAAGEGPHRYAWLMFAQPEGFAAPQALSEPNTAAGPWNVTSYVQESDLGDLVAASFFTVQNGQASYSVPSTTAFTATPTGGAGTTTAPGSTSPQSTTPASTPNAASFITMSNGAVVAVVACAFGFIAFA